MKQIIQYEASDGSIFKNEDACLEYDKLCDLVDEAMQSLPSFDIKSKQYYQHTKENVEIALSKMQKIWKKLYFPDSNENEIHPKGYVGRYASDGNLKCVRNATYRLGNINYDSYREYEQYYYSEHPSEATEELK